MAWHLALAAWSLPDPGLELNLKCLLQAMIIVIPATICTREMMGSEGWRERRVEVSAYLRYAAIAPALSFA